MIECATCTAENPVGNKFCATCGARTTDAPTAAASRTVSSGAGFKTSVENLQHTMPGPFSRIPPELLIVCALMALAGVLTLLPVLRALPSTFDLLQFSIIGLYLLDVLLVLGFFGVACLILSWRLAHGDRVARGLSYVLLGGLGGSILFGETHGTSLILVMLACFGSLAVLVAAPAVRGFFLPSDASAEPSSVVTARVLVTLWCGCAIAVGVLFLPLHEIGTKYVLVGVVLVGLGALGFRLRRGLAAGDPRARIAASIGAAAYAVLLLILGQHDAGLLLPLALAVGVLCFLWIPDDANRHFTQVRAA